METFKIQNLAST